MKNKSKIILALLCMLTLVFALSLTACGSDAEEAAQEETTILSEEELLDIALDDAGFNLTAADNVKIKIKADSNVRTVSFTISGAEYSYQIDASTGEILDSTKPEVAPEADTDPVSLAMSKMGQEPDFAGASNIKAKKSGNTVIINFDNNGNSYEYHYDIPSGELSKQ